MGESHEHVEQKKPETKGYMLFDSIYIIKRNRKDLPMLTVVILGEE